jgi:hypothetical protein
MFSIDKGGLPEILKNNKRKAKRMDQYIYWLTRMKVLHCRMELTGQAGKIERSADAFQAQNGFALSHKKLKQYSGTM